MLNNVGAGNLDGVVVDAKGIAEEALRLAENHVAVDVGGNLEVDGQGGGARGQRPDVEVVHPPHALNRPTKEVRRKRGGVDENEREEGS